MLLKRKRKHLSKSQEEALQSNKLDSYLFWNEHISHCFAAPHRLNIYKNDYETFTEYCEYFEDLQSARFKPNQNKLQLIEIGDIGHHKDELPLLVRFLESYYPGLQCAVGNAEQEHATLTLLAKQNKLELVYKENKLQLPLKTNALSGDQVISASALVKFFKQTEKNDKAQFSRVSFIDHGISLPPSANVVTGVSQGRDGSVISLKGCTFREIVSTTTHELLHVFNIGHCNQWHCICNYSYEFGAQSKDGGCLQLCPLCLQKLHYQLQFDVKERYEKLLQCCNYLNFKEDVNWLTQVLAGLEVGEEMLTAAGEDRHKKRIK